MLTIPKPNVYLCDSNRSCFPALILIQKKRKRLLGGRAPSRDRVSITQLTMNRHVLGIQLHRALQLDNTLLVISVIHKCEPQTADQHEIARIEPKRFIILIDGFLIAPQIQIRVRDTFAK